MNLETFDAPFVEPTTVDGISAVQLLAKIEERNPDKRIIHVIWDNAAYHKGPDVRAFLARKACRIHLVQLPPYCPHLNPGIFIEFHFGGDSEHFRRPRTFDAGRRLSEHARA